MHEAADEAQATPRRLIPAMLAGTVAACTWMGLAAAGLVTLGVPGEWAWRVHEHHPLDLGISVAIACMYFLIVIVAVDCAAARLTRRWRVGIGLIGLVVMSFVGLEVLETCAPVAHRQLKPMWVLYHWGSAGYFTEATEVRDLPEYLRTYEARLTDGDVLHQGTHPPGLVALNYGLLLLCRSSPTLASRVLSTAPEPVRRAFARAVPIARLPPPDRAALWLSVLLTRLAAALAVVPLFFLIRRVLPVPDAFRLSALWPLVPGIAIFSPKSDVLYPVIAGLLLHLWITACDTGSWRRGGAAGLVLFAGMWLSLAMLPLVLLGAVHTATRYWHGEQTPRSVLLAAAGGAVCFFGATVAAWGLWEVNLPGIWIWNLRNHAGFYEQFDRTYWKWLLVNPVELALTLGAPIVICCGAALWRWKSESSEPRAAVAAALLTWGLLWLSGKNMGEAARLWLFLAPAGLWVTAAALSVLETGGRRTGWRVLAGCQTIVAIVSLAVVNGFSDPL